jgi:hypothetical protein
MKYLTTNSSLCHLNQLPAQAMRSLPANLRKNLYVNNKLLAGGPKTLKRKSNNDNLYIEKDGIHSSTLNLPYQHFIY